MGNSPSSAAIGPLCAHPVTAHPTVARLTDRDVRNLNQLYGHDDELLQLMCAAELLRDCAKSAGDACALHFHHAFVDAKHERAFGEKLKEAAGRLNASGLAALVPAREADGSDASTEDRDASANDETDAADPSETDAADPSERPHLPAAGHLRPLGSPDRQHEKLTRVLDAEALVGALGDAHVAAANARVDFIERMSEKIRALARQVEKAHHVKLERHAPSAMAHEKAYNHMRAPRDRLATLMRMDAARRASDASAKRIDQAEVDLEKRRAQLEATTRMLKQRARVFLDRWTPAVREALLASRVLHGDALVEQSRCFDVLASDASEREGSVEHTKERARAFLDDDRSSSPPLTPDGSVATAMCVRDEQRETSAPEVTTAAA